MEAVIKHLQQNARRYTMTTLPDIVWSLTTTTINHRPRANSAPCVVGQPRRAVACALAGRPA